MNKTVFPSLTVNQRYIIFVHISVRLLPIFQNVLVFIVRTMVPYNKQTDSVYVDVWMGTREYFVNIVSLIKRDNAGHFRYISVNTTIIM